MRQDGALVHVGSAQPREGAEVGVSRAHVMEPGENSGRRGSGGSPVSSARCPDHRWAGSALASLPWEGTAGGSTWGALLDSGPRASALGRVTSEPFAAVTVAMRAAAFAELCES